MLDSAAEGNYTRVLSRQGGVTVTSCGNVVEKKGYRVYPNEVAAIKLVERYTDIPVPKIYHSAFTADEGCIKMSLMPGLKLEICWDDLDDDVKERLCREIWEMALKLREIPKPPEISHYFQCNADGTASNDVLITPARLENTDPAPLATDAAVRQRIYDRYYHFNGRRYEKELPSMLPRSSLSVFTHVDIAPRNIMVDKDAHVCGILDWESAGWYPDYWEYANIMKPTMDEDWQAWMDRMAPQRWDIEGIKAARRVLF
ncbi:hypothetical protein CC80DRAFT_495427 [Byssothecium circinans]|uniref:Aminoglycoside phosphotransferase domain-containing protein n=1 Tax=Byssothecium circinans TaxID=147558 RepID=A0A6A5TKW8_9PLEO|nr:hypothetical protein CC80DRAFT_495427 [Byssothecium circinans]